jgi:hypothetical protein
MSVLRSRRRFLRGLGVAMALPALESVGALRAFGAAKAAVANPLRMAFLYVPNGVILDQWRPQGVGGEYKLNATMEPLAPFRQDFSIVTGLAHQHGFANGDGAGDHARANATIFTGARPKKTAGADIRLGVSVDQFAAQRLGDATRFASLELSCDGVRKSGTCDSGYSCAYQYNLSWQSETQPVAPESNPRLVFERLFGSGDVAERRESYRTRQAEQRSILDFIADDAKSLTGQLGATDRHKLDEYLNGVREIERRLSRLEQFGDLPDPGVPSPKAEPKSYREHIRLMADMLVLAFQTDSTRIGTFLLAHDGSNRTFEEAGVRDGHHSLSHHQNDKTKIEKLAKIDHFYCEQLAYFLGRLRDTKDATGRSLLDDSMIVYASGLSDGNRHKHDDLPVIVAGRAGGAFRPGRHIQVDPQPMSNLFVTLLDTMGAKTETFGDSNGRLDQVRG